MENRRRSVKEVVLVLYVHYETKYGENIFVQFNLDGSTTPNIKRLDWTENNIWRAVLLIKCSSIRYRYYMEDVSKNSSHWEKESSSRTINFDEKGIYGSENDFEVFIDIWGEPKMSTIPNFLKSHIAEIQTINLPKELQSSNPDLAKEIERLKTQNSTTEIELKRLKEELEQTKQEKQKLGDLISQLQGLNLNTLSFSDLKSLHQKNKESSERITKRFISMMEEQVDVKQCIICCENTMDIACVPCGHICMCSLCAISLRKKGFCPTCRGKVTHLQKLFI